jgi:mycofactocin system FadH/OYE family oxidoreductase 2
MQRFDHLFSPIEIGPVPIRNRIVSTAMISNLADRDHLPNERHAYYYAEKAKGGVGLIVTESQAIHPTAGASAFAMAGYDPAVVPGYRRITEMVQAHGAKIFCQLNHGGREHNSLHSERELWAPSAIAGPYHREVPHEMTHSNIAELLDSYALVAGHAEAGNFDGIEIHAGHGYLLQQFMSPLTNHRTDQYGGSLENRIRLTREVIERVREVIGDRLALGLRVSSNEFTPGGLATEDMIPIVQCFADTGLLDYLSVSQSNYYSIETLMPDMSFSHAHFVPFTAQIKAAVPDVPVIAVGRIVRPEEAERVLANGQADLTGMTRALLSDPELPNKAFAGDVEGIRYCTGNNQGCVGRMFNGASTSCTHNPTIGYEREYGFESLVPQEDQLEHRIIVIGAGPAGLEAARVAASLGHRVTVLEQGDDIGGQLRLVSRTPQRAEWGELIRYFRVQLERLGVDVRLNKTATRELVLDMAPDGVVFAAGSEPIDPGIVSDGSTQILPDWEVFDLNVPRHSRIVVLAEEDHHESPSIAEYLADRSYSMDLVTSAPVVGRAVDIAGLPPLLRRLDEKQVRAHTSSSIGRIVDGTVFLDSARGQGVRQLEDVAAIVVCGLRKARTELYQQLLASFEVPVEVVGDAKAPRRANEAIREGHWAGRSVSKALSLHV